VLRSVAHAAAHVAHGEAEGYDPPAILTFRRCSGAEPPEVIVRVRTAVFPVAGWGTRFLPATKAVPKELLPVLDRPAIQYAMEEAIAAGIERIVLVTSDGKRAIEDHFDAAPDLEAFLEARGDIERLRVVRAVSDMVNLVTVRQKEQLGLGHAVLMARDAVGHESFAVVLPDDLIVSERPALSELIDAHEETHGSVVAVMEIPREDSIRYGVVEIDPDLPATDGGRTIPLRGLIEKPAPADAPSNLGIVGRYVLTPKIFEKLERTAHGVGNEIQLTDAIQALAAEQPIVGRRFSGRRFDVGSPEGWLAANIDLALDHPHYGGPLRTWLNARLTER
jgi:UTP--glucose-1-phosphate uridylyltransferase